LGAVAAVKLRWTRLALADLDCAREFIAAENPRAAWTTVERIETALKALARYPQIGRAGRVPGTRELVISGTPFIAAYRPGKQRIDILALIHAARQWPEEF
jgi:toxin ParE1/3/4